MKNFKFIPYDKNLVSRARELRKSLTEAEKKFWFEILRDERLQKFKFTQQKPLGHFIADFYCSSLQLAIEIDGAVHTAQKIRDKERDNFLKLSFNVKVIRYKNEDVLNNTKFVLEDLIQKIQTPPCPSGRRADLPLSGEE